jgi:ubiquinone/menaquinone biosynthesis C-methylase UbiE
MPAYHDPEETEIKYLYNFLDNSVNFSGARTLEIGSGDGRLLWKYAASAGQTTGIDPSPNKLAAALRDCPAGLQAQITFALSMAESLPFTTNTFDSVLLAWSL